MKMKPSLLLLPSTLSLIVYSLPSIIHNLATRTSTLPSSAFPSLHTLHEIELRKRVVATTTSTTVPPLQTALCGWLGGDPAQPWTCAIDGECVIATAPATNAVGCCVGGKCATFRTSCIPATAACDAACSSNKANLICPTASPLCATYTYPGSYTELRCTNSIPVQNQLQVAFTFSGFTTPLPLPRVLSTMTDCDSTGRCDPDLTVMTQIPDQTTSPTTQTTQTTKTPTTSTSNPTTTSSTSTPNPSSSSSDTGAIVGGVVGGIAGLALIGGGLFLYYMRKKRAGRMSGGGGSAAALGGGHIQSPYHSPDPNSQPIDREWNSNSNGLGEGQVYGGAVKAELPATAQFHGGGMDPIKVPVREVWEMDGIARQDMPLMEMDGHDRTPR